MRKALCRMGTRYTTILQHDTLFGGYCPFHESINIPCSFSPLQSGLVLFPYIFLIMSRYIQVNTGFNLVTNHLKPQSKAEQDEASISLMPISPDPRDRNKEWVGPSQFSRGLRTRNVCLLGLIATWAIGLACLVGGGFYLNKTPSSSLGWLRITMSRTLKETLPLIINVLVTIVTEGTGFIHATTLRWALGNDLTFNSNLRLFSRVRGSWAFGGLSNFLNAALLILCYAATSLIFANLPPSDVCDALPLNGYDCTPKSNFNVTYVSPGAIMALGVGLTGTAALTTWQFFASRVEAWSSSPIQTAWAFVASGRRSRVVGRCMVSVHDVKLPAAPTFPQQRQRSAWSAHPEVRRILRYLWALTVLVLLWFVGLLISITVIWKRCETEGSHAVYVDICRNIYHGPSWSLLPDTNGITSLAQINLVDDAGGKSHTGAVPKSVGFALAFIMMMGFQAMLTMGLHCADLLVNMSRDEDTWRKSSQKGGYTSQNALMTALCSWKSWLLFVLKPLIHWFFGLGMTFYIGWGIFMRPPQILYTSFAVLFLAIFGTYLCFERPKGPQPATFGHVQTLMNLIDEWGEPMFWGHKVMNADLTSRAGTARSALGPIEMRNYYW